MQLQKFRYDTQIFKGRVVTALIIHLLSKESSPPTPQKRQLIFNHGIPPNQRTELTIFQGKQHGSLARAGKVKSQTPKVEKQEKKKKPKGRAMKRLLYNRRFVTVANQRPGAKRRVRLLLPYIVHLRDDALFECVLIYR